jgi:hypothetical protein
MGERYGVCHVDPTLVLLLESDVGRFLVESDSEALQFRLYYSFMSEGFVDVQNNENEITSSSHGNYLTTSTLSMRFGPKNGKMEKCTLPSLAPSMIPGKSRI